MIKHLIPLLGSKKDNTTIGAGSVVTKSIPANCLAAGNPCKVIRELYIQTAINHSNR
ncbi:hypothetical protein [Parabacteroides sp. PF5-9]|uniref:hypothetical protein n=1 Tax=Parabacteroides sp. PF5-9 TaxID=1742404 RepID=UPI0024771232|nr:hypothetical protein [Parabacteroides sp. PF5-9]MDH6358451.1 acetyltransferase-like isoleucine patch superfamily enzyme [Parabacteroides sp. PF5-9]